MKENIKERIKEDAEIYVTMFSTGIIVAAGVAIGWNIVNGIFRGRK